MNPLKGTWRLTSFAIVRSTGAPSYPFGDDPVGLFIYGADGRFSVQIMRNGRPVFIDADMQRGSDDEVRAAYSGYIAYFGKYTVAEGEGKVTHHVEDSLYPNWIGHAQERFYERVGGRLTLKTPPTPFGGDTITGVLTWELLG